MREWRTASSELPASRHPDHAGFRRWLGAFETGCADHRWIDRFALADRLADADSFPHAAKLAIAGFDGLTTQQLHLVTALIDRGASVDIIPLGQRDPGDLPCFGYADADGSLQIEFRLLGGRVVQRTLEASRMADGFYPEGIPIFDWTYRQAVYGTPI